LAQVVTFVVGNSLKLVDRSFQVAAPLPAAWNYLAEIERWPSWARHIRSAQMLSPGPLGPSSAATVALACGVTSTFRMTEWDPFHHWKWSGLLLGSEVTYDHIFRELGPDRTSIRFVIDMEGVSAYLVGHLAGWIYRLNLRRAIPILVDEMASALGARTFLPGSS
jgi:uncharacterized membrane protein